MLVRVMEALHNLNLAIKYLVYRVLLFCLFLLCLTIIDEKTYWLRIMEVPKFQAKVSIPMMLREVFEAFVVADLDSGPISLINGVLGDVCQVL
jgi:hypothetical protein